MEQNFVIFKELIKMFRMNQLPYLLYLLEDPDPVVRENVLKELDAYNHDLEKLVFDEGFVPDEMQSSLLAPLFKKRRRTTLELEWQKLSLIENDMQQLEEGFKLISDFQNGPRYPIKLSRLLDMFADEYRAKRGTPDIFDLADFLFTAKNLGKPESNDFYNPRNSNLVSVIERGKGLPISLCAIYILIGERLHLNIEGCNFPGHFLARARINNSVILIDCYNGGIRITEDEFPQLEEALYPKGKQVINDRVNAHTILRRVLFNLVSAYGQQNDKENADFFFGILEDF